jgi:SAM-dependent MidA family methyltransferase
MTRDPLGRDFITAPEVSQIFGELIGLFFVQAWEDRGRPPRFHFVELGPGRGTLMADMLRAAAKVRPGFAAAAQVVLVEASPVLRSIQARTLEGRTVAWAASLADVPDDAPLFLVANEFFDALPIRQFVKQRDGWHERRITAEGDSLVFSLTSEPVVPPSIHQLDSAENGAVFETSPAAETVIADIARRAGELGLALIIDYGHTGGFGETFQAVKAHAYADPLAEPGEADLTAHVDFAALSAAATKADVLVLGPTPQGSFLDLIGIRARAQRLRAAAPELAVDIDAAVDRLTSPAQMGSLFKVMAITDGHFGQPPGFVR